MIDKVLRISGLASLYLFASLFLALIILLVYLKFAWGIDKSKWTRMLAIAQGYDVLLAQAELNKAVEERLAKLTSEEVLAIRAQRLREEEFKEDKRNQGFDHVLSEGREIESKLDDLKKRIAAFEKHLKDVDEKARDEGITQETAMLEKLTPQLGKRAVMKILKESGGLERIIMILKIMEVNARRKILNEMKEEDELTELVKILQKVGDGDPVAKLVKEAQGALPTDRQPR